MQIDAAWFKKNERFVIAGIIALAMLHGLFYIYVVPPWQHHDEPNHFEYAWTIVNTGELPVPDVYDWTFRSEIVRSLIEHGFYTGLREPDPENLDSVPDGLRYSQLDDRPLYYLLVSVAIRLTSSTDLADQLIAGRYVSLLLLGVTVLASWGLAAEVTMPGSPIRFFVPLTIAMLPGFIDLMTSVNNDVGATAIFSLFLWGCVRLIRRGPALLTVLWVVSTVIAAVYTKSTAFLAVPLAPIALVLGLLPGGYRRYAWIATGLAAAGLGFGLLYLQEPAYWYRATAQEQAIRLELPTAPHGSHVLALDPSAGITPSWLRAINQPLPREDVERLAGRSLTLGFWMWFDAADAAAANVTVPSPALNIDVPGRTDLSFSLPLSLTRFPQFYSFTVDVPADAVRIWISMRGDGPEIAGLRLLYDGIVAAEGTLQPGAFPTLTAADGSGGDWAGVPFTNLVRNPSAEMVWPAFRPAADNLAARLLPSNVRLTILLYSVLDREGASWYYFGAGANIFETFWGRFGWGHVPLPGGRLLYDLFAIAVILAIVGAVFYPFDKGGKIPVDSLLFIGLAMVLVWFAALARGAIFIFVEHVFQPSARYGYPAIAPTALLLVAGWTSVGLLFRRTFRIPVIYLVAIYVDLLLMLDVLALWGIARFYAGA